jgi:hypothetical protein
LKYFLIHCVDRSSKLGPGEAARDEELLNAWLDETVRGGVNLHGSRLEPDTAAKCVRVRNGEVLITDGPFAETKEQIGGYDVLECADLDQALAVAARHPTVRTGTIEVRPFLDL